MKLSEAIRLGAMMKPQAFGVTRDDDRNCALGSALDAIGKTEAHYTDVFREWPETTSHVLCPGDGEGMMLLSSIRLLNDRYRWTRESIADWVETIEAQQQEQPATPARELIEAQP